MALLEPRLPFPMHGSGSRRAGFLTPPWTVDQPRGRASEAAAAGLGAVGGVALGCVAVLVLAWALRPALAHPEVAATLSAAWRGLRPMLRVGAAAASFGLWGLLGGTVVAIAVAGRWTDQRARGDQ